MTLRNELQSLKTTAKRIARARRIAHHEALDLIARKLRQPHWNALVAAWETGWRPEGDAVEALASAEKTIDPDVMAISILGIGQGVEEHGHIDGVPYTLEIDFEVVMWVEGRWAICVEHAPSKEPIIEIYDRSENNPILNTAFRSKALAICREAVERLRARIAADWPRRSTKPDAEGNAQHPLSKGVASRWYCLHCDGAFTASQMSENMWHCPKCSATPIDIFIAPFWKAA
ncbi:hypothetical protein IVB46_41875 [Bradyrhizobium sp. 61]|uniref:hypothetical protein n=1 Tax=Bradyrhizobium sp. 61 TaxID=2782679 RepID=UPI001FF7797A|nr:hypothetical protein [Bradyrhizobium sp. 61]MCK1281784.1 hypothetical protein [Bradyrhizobium sp. 61]